MYNIHYHNIHCKSAFYKLLLLTKACFTSEGPLYFIVKLSHVKYMAFLRTVSQFFLCIHAKFRTIMLHMKIKKRIQKLIFSLFLSQLCMTFFDSYEIHTCSVITQPLPFKNNMYIFLKTMKQPEIHHAKHNTALHNSCLTQLFIHVLQLKTNLFT